MDYCYNDCRSQCINARIVNGNCHDYDNNGCNNNRCNNCEQRVRSSCCCREVEEDYCD